MSILRRILRKKKSSPLIPPFLTPSYITFFHLLGIENYVVSPKSFLPKILFHPLYSRFFQSPQSRSPRRATPRTPEGRGLGRGPLGTRPLGTLRRPLARSTLDSPRLRGPPGVKRACALGESGALAHWASPDPDSKGVQRSVGCL